MSASGSKPSVGICVLNANSGPRLAVCVQQLMKSASLFELDVVVVDNASEDGSVPTLLTEVPGIRIMRNAVDVGRAAGRNRGGRLLLTFGCEYVVFIDPHVRIEPPALGSLIDALRQAEDRGCAGGVPFSAAGEPRAAGMERPSLLERIILYGPLRRVPVLRAFCDRAVIHARDLPARAEVHSITGACMAFRADALRLTGGFDERAFRYEEELIIAERLRRTFWKTVIAPAARYTMEALPRSAPAERRHFHNSEFHLLSAYYNWNPALCAGIRWYRRLEWFLSRPAGLFAGFHRESV